jgi:hypothetical protein
MNVLSVRNFGLIVFMITLFAHAYAVPTTAPSDTPPVPNDAAIVQADVVNIADAGTSFLVTLQVTHLYCGSIIKDGGTFQTAARKTPAESAPAGVFPVPKMGEHGLWFVGVTRDGKCFGLERAPEPLNMFPARQGIDARYPAVQQLAKLIESVCHAPLERRVELLRKSAADNEGIVAAWAIRYLAKVSIEEVVRLANAVARGDSEIGIAGQVAIDTALSEDWRAEWMKSPDRIALLNAWAASQPANADTAMSIAQRLNWISQQPELADNTLVHAMETLSLNRMFTEEARRFCIRAIGVLATRNPSRIDLATILTHLAESTDTDRLRDEAKIWRSRLK